MISAICVQQLNAAHLPVVMTEHRNVISVMMLSWRSSSPRGIRIGGLFLSTRENMRTELTIFGKR